MDSSWQNSFDILFWFLRNVAFNREPIFVFSTNYDLQTSPARAWQEVDFKQKRCAHSNIADELKSGPQASVELLSLKNDGETKLYLFQAILVNLITRHKFHINNCHVGCSFFQPPKTRQNVKTSPYKINWQNEVPWNALKAKNNTTTNNNKTKQSKNMIW